MGNQQSSTNSSSESLNKFGLETEKANVSSPTTPLSSSSSTELQYDVFTKKEAVTAQEDSNTWEAKQTEIIGATKSSANKIGKGTFGDVFQLGPGLENWAVKKLRSRYTPEEIKDALKEVDLMKNKHENLVSVEHHFIHNERLYIVMERMDGSLSQLLYEKDKNTQLLRSIFLQQPLQVISLFLQIARGIQELHSRRIVHRDIKPENILLKKQIKNGNVVLKNVKLSDFGVSNKGSQFFTNTGTPGYMAPEINNSGYVENVDIYSFGVVIGEVVCGERPGQGNLSSFTEEKFKQAGYGHLFYLYKNCTLEDPRARTSIDKVVSELNMIYIKTQWKEDTKPTLLALEKYLNTVPLILEENAKKIFSDLEEKISDMENEYRKKCIEIVQEEKKLLRVIGENPALLKKDIDSFKEKIKKTKEEVFYGLLIRTQSEKQEVFRTEKKELEDKLNYYKNQVNILKEELKKSEALIKFQNTQEVSQNKLKSDIQSKTEDIIVLNDIIRDLREKLEHMSNESNKKKMLYQREQEKIQKELKEAKNEISKLRKELEDARQCATKEMESTQTERAKTKKKIQDLKKEIDNLLRENEELKKQQTKKEYEDEWISICKALKENLKNESQCSSSRIIYTTSPVCHFTGLDGIRCGRRITGEFGEFCNRHHEQLKTLGRKRYK
jgi:serine/threonine protein kinase